MENQDNVINVDFSKNTKLPAMFRADDEEDVCPACGAPESKWILDEKEARRLANGFPYCKQCGAPAHEALKMVNVRCVPCKGSEL